MTRRRAGTPYMIERSLFQKSWQVTELRRDGRTRWLRPVYFARYRWQCRLFLWWAKLTGRLK